MYLGRIFTFLLMLTVANAIGTLWHLKRLRLHMKHILPLLAVHGLGKHKTLPVVLPLPIPIHHQPILTHGNTVLNHGCNKWKPYFHKKPFHLGHHHYLDDLYSHHDADLDGCHNDDHHFHHHHHHHHHNEYKTHKTVFLPSFPHHHHHHPNIHHLSHHHPNIDHLSHHHPNIDHLSHHHPNIDHLSHHNGKLASDTYLHPIISNPPERMIKTETYQRPSIVILPKKKSAPDDEFVNIRDWRPRGKEVRFVKKLSPPRLLYKSRPQKKTIILIEKNEDKDDNEDEDDEIVNIRDWRPRGKKVRFGEEMRTRKKAVDDDDDEDDEEDDEEEKTTTKRKKENSGKRRKYT